MAAFGLGSVVLAGGVAYAAAAPKKAPPARAVNLPMGRSVGSPTEGHLVGGAHLEDALDVRIVPAYANGDVRWGLGSLVGLLDRGARAVHKRWPDALLSVGHLSKKGGGEIDRHASHESGRDADVAFYVKDARGKPVYADHFVTFGADGAARNWPGAMFDDARNWALVAALVSDPLTHVSHIFVSTALRARLLAFAARAGVAPEVQAHAAATMAQPHGSLPHDDHFHVRVSCPSGMQGCVENPTIARRSRLKVRAGHASAAIGSQGATASKNAAPAAEARAAPSADRAPKEPVAADRVTPPPAVQVAPVDDVDGT